MPNNYNQVNDDAGFLLEQIANIDRRFHEIEKASGESYNLLRVLKLTTNEEVLHSRFIGDLLNPHGEHGMGAAFLTCFIQQLPVDNSMLQSPDDSTWETARVKVEEFCGPINWEDCSGGSIDVSIRRRRGRPIFIENKIYATDQPQQLARYYNAGHNPLVIYLTLFGENPSDDARGTLELGSQYLLISYQTEIINWLRRCISLASEKPFLRESLRQYQVVVKELTQQSTNAAMSKEIIDLILTRRWIEAAKQVSVALPQCYSALVHQCLININDRLNDSAISISSPNEKIPYLDFAVENTALTIRLEFEGKLESNPWLGVQLKGENASRLNFELTSDDASACKDVINKSNLAIGNDHTDYVWLIRLEEYDSTDWYDVPTKFAEETSEIIEAVKNSLVKIRSLRLN